MDNINFKIIEKKWQDKWEKNKVFVAKENSKKKKYYVLEMFPYPSGTGLHIGHALNYIIGDIYVRFKRMKGFNVLYPMGYDSLGLPAENAAIKVKISPKKYTENSIKNFIKQQKSLGLSYDWSRMVITSIPEYYKWDQWIFLKMLEKGLAYKKKSSVNYCKKCDTVLANEQVHNGKCWRHSDVDVEIKQLNQWYFKITDYAEELNNFEGLKQWPELIKKLQKNWIGKSFGSEILFEIEINGKGEKWPVFTTRADTLYGVTFMVVSAQHSRLFDLVKDDKKEDVKKFLKKLNSVSQEDIEQLEKEGIFTGSYAINPITKEKIPIYVGNFVLADYGSGMVMAVPAHDQRDFEFAKKYKIKIKGVVKGGNIKERAYTGEGVMINSEKFNGLENKKAIQEITNFLNKEKLGKKTIQFRLKDWLISRQRYWGTPIPIVYCDKCGIVPIPENELPIVLPGNVKFGKGNPLENIKKWINVKCPKCNGDAKRETDTMDTFVNSSWYYLRYLDNKNNKAIFNKEKANYWCPVDFYIGGKEHACMHLIYIRFYTKFLRDLRLLNFDEPAIKLFNQGMLHGEDGNKMSKSLGNVIDPLIVIKKYSADALRLFLVSVSSPDSDMNWSDKGVDVSFKFLIKICDYFNKSNFKKSSKRAESKTNKAIKEIELDIENLKYNLAVIKLKKLFDVFVEEKNNIAKKDVESFLKLLHVFCPHLSEELWERMGNKRFLSLEKWPVCDEEKIDNNLEKQEQIIDNVLSDINNIIKIIREKNKDVKDIYLYATPNELEIYNEDSLSKKIGKKVKVFAVNNKNKYDPENKSKKAKPGKPGIYVE